MEETLESPRISFSHDLANITTTPTQTDRSDMSLMSRLSEPEFDFANAAATDVAPADRLFSGGKLLPLPPLPPSPNICHKSKPSCTILHDTMMHTNSNPKNCRKPQTCQKSAFWTSRFSRSSSVNSGTTRRSTSGTFCPSFPLLRSRSACSAAAAAAPEGFCLVSGHRPQYKKVSATTNTTTSTRVYYYGASTSGTSSHGVRISPVLNVPCIGTSVVNVFSYLLCDCGSKSVRTRGFGVTPT